MRRLSFACSLSALLAVTVLVGPQAARGELAKSTLLETNVAYLRVGQADKDLSEEMGSALGTLTATNQIEGIVLDLRFAGGSDAGDLKPAEHLLEKENVPVAVLVNSDTSGAAVRLAEDLRDDKNGLIFGSAAEDLQPDITILVSAKDEKSFLKNPYLALSQSDTNSETDTNLLPFVDIDHTTEADLVRNKIKDGDQDGTSDPGPTADQQKNLIRDPVLAHGVDFIKGLAALHFSKK
jgi:hypothetical protein